MKKSSRTRRSRTRNIHNRTPVRTIVRGTNRGTNRSHSSSGLKPPKFSWLVECLLAGQGRPTKPGHLHYLHHNAVKYLVILTINKPKAVVEYSGGELEWVHIPIQDETPPSLDQIQQFLDTVDRAKAEGVGVSVHCAWGRGRTGTMLACYLLREDPSHDPDTAISAIREARPGSIDTDTQIRAIREYSASLQVFSRSLKPPKFSWLVEGLLAGQGRPTKPGHLHYLHHNAVKYLVILTINKPKAVVEYSGGELEWVHIPIQDETPPSLDQIQQFLDTVDKAKAEGVGVSVHCAWGRGRTGTMLACYLLREDPSHDADRAISAIREARPGSIDTETQIRAIREYSASLLDADTAA